MQKLFVLVCVILLIHGTEGTAELPKFYLETLSYAGSGCPQGSVGTSVANDRSSATMIFDSFVASKFPEGDIRNEVMDCSIIFTFSSSVTCFTPVITSTIRGYLQLAQGTSSINKASLKSQFFGSTEEEIWERSGPVSQDYVVDHTAQVLNPICSSTYAAIITFEVALDGDGGQSQGTIDSLDFKFSFIDFEPSPSGRELLGNLQGSPTCLDSRGSLDKVLKPGLWADDKNRVAKSKFFERDQNLVILCDFPNCVSSDSCVYACTQSAQNAAFVAIQDISGLVSRDGLANFYTAIHNPNTFEAIEQYGLAWSSAQDGPTRPNLNAYIQSITYGGNGCPQGTVGLWIAPDRHLAYAIFDSFIAAKGSDIPASEAQKNCQLNVNLNVPSKANALLQLQAFGELAGQHYRTDFSFQSNFNGKAISPYIQYISGENLEFEAHPDLIPLTYRYFEGSNKVIPFNINAQIEITKPKSVTNNYEKLAAVNIIAISILNE